MNRKGFREDRGGCSLKKKKDFNNNMGGRGIYGA